MSKHKYLNLVFFMKNISARVTINKGVKYCFHFFFKKLCLASLLWSLAHTATAANFVLVHGSWHGAWAWYKIQTLLESQGHTVTVVDLPAHGIDLTPAETVLLQDYVDTVIDALNDYSGSSILVGHSMGGIVVSEAAEALPGKVAKSVYLAAFMIPSGNSLVDFADIDLNSQANQNLIPVDLNGDNIPDAIDLNKSIIGDVLYGRSNQADITLASTVLRPDPIAPVVTPLLLGSNYDSVPRFYIKTLQDQVITPEIQEMMLDITSVEKDYKINSDHSPFFSKPVQLTVILNRIANY